MALPFQAPNASFVAAGDIYPARFVKQSGSFGVAQAGAGENTVGVSQPNTKSYDSLLAAATGNYLAVAGESQETYLSYGASVTAGARLKPDSAGKGVTAGSTESSGAVALEDGASGDGTYRVRVETFIAPGAGATGAQGATGPQGATGATGPGA